MSTRASVTWRKATVINVVLLFSAATAKANLKVNVKEVEAGPSSTRASPASRKKNVTFGKRIQTANEIGSNVTITYKSLPSRRKSKSVGSDSNSGASGGKYHISGYMEDQVTVRDECPYHHPALAVTSAYEEFSVCLNMSL